MLDLCRVLTARVGGCVEEVHEPEDRGGLVACLERLTAEGRPFHLLGGGSNVLAADTGLARPLVLTRRLRRVEQLSATRCRVEAGASLTALAHKTARRGWSGLECCAGIPGTLGGAIHINAGGRYGNVAGVVRELTLFTASGVETREVSAADFGYRTTRFFKDVVLAAELEFRRVDPRDAMARIREVVGHKRVTQPLSLPSAGCVFRNPPGASAGQLIDRAGLKGLRVGGAMVSSLHANYFVNAGGATGRDFLELIDRVRGRVLALCGVNLELEVEVWGEEAARPAAAGA